jgi:hypothetical protein
LVALVRLVLLNGVLGVYHATQSHLPTQLDPSLGDFVRQADLVRAFEEAGAKLRV